MRTNRDYVLYANYDIEASGVYDYNHLYYYSNVESVILDDSSFYNHYTKGFFIADEAVYVKVKFNVKQLGTGDVPKIVRRPYVSYIGKHGWWNSDENYVPYKANTIGMHECEFKLNKGETFDILVGTSANNGEAVPVVNNVSIYKETFKLQEDTINLDKVVDRIDVIEQQVKSVRYNLIEELERNNIECTGKESFETLVSYVGTLKGTPPTMSVYEFSVNAGTTIVLQDDDLRGITGSTPAPSWGDGSIQSPEPSHTYNEAGTYKVKTWFSVVNTNNSSDSTTRSSLRRILKLHDGITNMSNAFAYCSYLNRPYCGNNVTNMAAAYMRCYNLHDPVCGPNVTDMRQAYANCWYLTGSPVCGPNVTNMAYAYDSCSSLTGTPVCGDKVTDFSGAYRDCGSITGSPVIGPNVTSMHNAYYGCSSITGTAVCGAKITNLYYTYRHCTKLQYPVCGANVTDLYYTYANCTNLIGPPVCGAKVTNMCGTYASCDKLVGPPVCGALVTDMRDTYAGCDNLTGTAACGANVTTMYNAYYACKKLTKPVCGVKVKNMENTYTHCYNLQGPAVCGPNVTSMVNTYLNCYNLTGSPTCGANVTNMYKTYSGCSNLTGNPVCGSLVTNMYDTYVHCYNLTGSPVCGNNVTNMSGTYYNCQNLTGSPVCGPNVTNMSEAYCNCINLTGAPACGNNVTNMSSAYANCHGLNAQAQIKGKTINASRSYYNCQNIGTSYGYPYIVDTCNNISYAFYNCPKVTGVSISDNAVNVAFAYAQSSVRDDSYIYANNITNAKGFVYNRRSSAELALFVYPNTSTWNSFLKTDNNSIVNAPITWTNGTYQGSFPYPTYYNAYYNIHIGNINDVVMCCFDKGTKILMCDESTKNIEDIHLGDIVMTFNETTNEFEPGKVRGIKHNPKPDDLVYLYLSNGVKIGMKAYHPLLTEKGWRSLRPELPEVIREVGKVPMLEEGDILVGYKNNPTILQIEYRPEPENAHEYITYNLDIDNNDTYIADGVVAHNAPCM